MTAARLRTIRRAVAALGSEKALADALGVRLQEVAGWMSGATVPHDRAYFAALDIVASGPLSGRTRSGER